MLLKIDDGYKCILVAFEGSVQGGEEVLECRDERRELLLWGQMAQEGRLEFLIGAWRWNGAAFFLVQSCSELITRVTTLTFRIVPIRL